MTEINCVRLLHNSIYATHAVVIAGCSTMMAASLQHEEAQLGWGHLAPDCMGEEHQEV